MQWPDGFEQLFDDLPPWTDPDPATTKLIEAADSVTATMIGDLVDRVVATPALDGRSTPSRAGSFESQEDILRMIEQWVVPARNPQSLCAILNAAWQAFQNKNLWTGRREIHDKNATLRELVLKSIEVLEYHERIREYDERNRKAT